MRTSAIEVPVTLLRQRIMLGMAGCSPGAAK